RASSSAWSRRGQGAVGGQQVLGRLLDAGVVLGVQVGQQGEHGAGVGDLGQAHRLVQDPDGRVGVAQVLEGNEGGAQLLGAGVVLLLQRRQQAGRAARAHAAR